MEERPAKLDLGSESGLCVRKVLAPYNVHTKMIPLIKYAKKCDFLECLIFPKEKEKNACENKDFFKKKNYLDSTRIKAWSYIIPFTMKKNQGLYSSKSQICFRKNKLMPM